MRKIMRSQSIKKLKSIGSSNLMIEDFSKVDQNIKLDSECKVLGNRKRAASIDQSDISLPKSNIALLS